MSDLVKRLREGIEQDQHGPYIFSAESLMDEAADRIEHLERVLILAREAMEVAENAARREAIAAIDEALNPQTIGTSDAS